MENKILNRFVIKAENYASGYNIKTKPPGMLLNYIMNCIERVQNTSHDQAQKDIAMDKIWKSYRIVQARINSNADESWGNAKLVDNKKGVLSDPISYYGENFEDIANNWNRGWW
jgi:hypothetical protein